MPLKILIFLSQDHFSNHKMSITLKYIGTLAMQILSVSYILLTAYYLCDYFMFHFVDPTYMIRAVPSNASDNVYSTLLAHSAVHGAMAGYTGFTVGPVNGRHAYIPFPVSLVCLIILRCN